MLFLTRRFGVTGSDAERDHAAEEACIEEIKKKILLLQAKTAAQQNRPIGRGTHVKGVCVRGEFEVFDVASGHDPELVARLAKGIFAKPGVYPAVVRFSNSDSKINSDFKPDVRSLSFSVDLTRAGTSAPGGNVDRQDFSLQNAPPLPINDVRAMLVAMKLLTASNLAVGLWSLSFNDKLRALRVIVLTQLQYRQTIKAYQQLRYWSNVPFSHGPANVVQYSATPSPDNPGRPLQKTNPKGLQDELIRHVQEDSQMSSFDFGVQFLDPNRMTYWGKRRDANFWIENASVKWNEQEAPFHTVARLTLLPKSQLQPDAAEAVYFDVTGNSTPDSTPLGSINRARQQGEAASRKARTQAASSRAPNIATKKTGYRQSRASP
jgi:hypothetical protein